MELLNNADEAMVTRVFTTAILTYCCAEMMGVGDLRNCVVARLMDRERYLSHSYLGRVLETLFTNTKPEDRPMRISLVFRCLVNHEVISGHFPSAVAVLEKYEKVSWEVSLLCKKKMVQGNEILARQNDNLKKRVADLECEYSTLRMVCICGRESGKWAHLVNAVGTMVRRCPCGNDHLEL